MQIVNLVLLKTKENTICQGRENIVGKVENADSQNFLLGLHTIKVSSPIPL